MIYVTIREENALSLQKRDKKVPYPSILSYIS